MAEEKTSEGRSGPNSSGGGATGSQGQTGDPGRTPGTAEGDRETVEEDLENREGGGK